MLEAQRPAGAAVKGASWSLLPADRVGVHQATSGRHHQERDHRHHRGVACRDERPDRSVAQMRTAVTYIATAPHDRGAG
jgi:hypothetical protein